MKKYVFFKLTLIKIKKFLFIPILLLFQVFICVQPVVCADSIEMKLSEIEKNYYGYTVTGSAESRLNRLEKNVYGSSGLNMKATKKDRVEKLYNDLGLGANSLVVSDTSDIGQDIGPKADAGIKYPVVDKLEEKALKKTYKDEDIYTRLSRLEKQVFPNNKGKSTQSLNARVDALRDKILGGTRTAYVDINPETEEIILDNGKKYYGDYEQYSNISENNDISHYNYYSYENSKNRISKTQSSYDYNSSVGSLDGIVDDGGFSTSNYGQSYDLDILEKSLLGKKYAGEAPSKRLARLETKVFSRTFNDDDESRIQRLLAVTTAQKTSHEYDSNKWARRLNAGIQIGSILLMVLAMIL